MVSAITNPIDSAFTEIYPLDFSESTAFISADLIAISDE